MIQTERKGPFITQDECTAEGETGEGEQREERRGTQGVGTATGTKAAI